MTHYTDAFTSANPQSTLVQILDIVFIDGYFPLQGDPSGWDLHLDADIAYGLSVPDAPVTVRLQQVTLAPGAVLEPPPEAITQLGITLASDMPLHIQDTETIGNSNQTPATVQVVTLTVAPEDSADP